MLVLLPQHTTLLVRAAHDPKVAQIALPLVRRRREKGTGDRVADRFGDLDRRSARSVIKRDD